MQLIILGMHRSGTSVLARVLNLMGAYFGPEGKSTGANAENPTGFWERKDVRSLNDAVLRAAGCDWNRVLEFDIAKLPGEAVEHFNRHAGRLVLEIDAHRPWFMKEPRLCLLYPLWRRFLDVPVCIHILRSPIEVAASLHTRNGMPIDAGMMLWERYVRSAFSTSAGDPAIVVSHRALVQRPDPTLTSLFDDLERHGVHGLRMPAERELRALVREDLYRQRESHNALRPYSGRSQMALFERLEDGGLATPLGTIDNGDPAALARYEASLPPLQPPAPNPVGDSGTAASAPRREPALRDPDAEWQARVEAIESSLRSTSDELAKAELRLAAHAGELEKVKTERARVEEIAEARLRDLARLTRVLQQRDVVAAPLAASNRKLVERVARAKERLATVRTKRSQFKVMLRAARRELTATRRGFEKRLAKSEKRLASALTDRSSLEASLQAATHALAARGHTVARLHGETRQLREASRGLVKQLAKLKKRLAATRKDGSRLKTLSDIALRDAELSLRQAQIEGGIAARELGAIKNSRLWRLAAIARWGRRVLGRSAADDAQRKAVSEAFDGEWYLTIYPDVAASGTDPLAHYLSIGWKEWRNPSAAFDTRNYLLRNEDVAKAGINPLLHYVVNGRAEGRDPC